MTEETPSSVARSTTCRSPSSSQRREPRPPGALLERLSDRLDLLRGPRDADERQRTLRATIDWSYDLLTEDEQRVFRAWPSSPAVHAGRCRVRVPSRPRHVLSLVAKSLLRFRDEGRYAMLETIREYATEQLEAAGETDALARRHADYHLALLEDRQPLMLGSGRRELLAWFGEEEDNLRATLDYLERAAPPDAARAAGLLTWFWLPRGRAVEAQERLLRLLARTHFAAGTRAMLLDSLAGTELRLGQLDGAESHAQEAVTLAHESGERGTLASALWSIAGVATHRGDFDEAIRLLTRAVEEAADDDWLRSGALRDLASAQMEAGRDEEARRLFQEASRGFHAMEDDANEAMTSTVSRVPRALRARFRSRLHRGGLRARAGQGDRRPLQDHRRSHGARLRRPRARPP